MGVGLEFTPEAGTQDSWGLQRTGAGRAVTVLGIQVIKEQPGIGVAL